MSTKLILALGVVALLGYTGISYGLRQRFPRLEVAADTALKGRVSSVVHVNDSHFFFLKGQKTIRYDFDAFAPVKSQEPLRQHSGSLNHYLHIGDSISKRAHSVELVVWRGQRVSRWACPPADAGQ